MKRHKTKLRGNGLVQYHGWTEYDEKPGEIVLNYEVVRRLYGGYHNKRTKTIKFSYPKIKNIRLTKKLKKEIMERHGY